MYDDEGCDLRFGGYQGGVGGGGGDSLVDEGYTKEGSSEGFEKGECRYSLLDVQYTFDCVVA
jgi:hypothetical protein